LRPLHCSVCVSLVLLTARRPTEIHTLSLHDALPISPSVPSPRPRVRRRRGRRCGGSPSSGGTSGVTPVRRKARSMRSAASAFSRDRKSTRLNSSHVKISYAVFCLKKKNKKVHHLHAV